MELNKFTFPLLSAIDREMQHAQYEDKPE